MRRQICTIHDELLKPVAFFTQFLTPDIFSTFRFLCGGIQRMIDGWKIYLVACVWLRARGLSKENPQFGKNTFPKEYGSLTQSRQICWNICLLCIIKQNWIRTNFTTLFWCKWLIDAICYGSTPVCFIFPCARSSPTNFLVWRTIVHICFLFQSVFLKKKVLCLNV